MSSWVSSYTPDSGQVIVYLKSPPVQSARAYVLIEFLALQRQRPYIVAKCSVFIPTVSVSFLQSFHSFVLSFDIVSKQIKIRFFYESTGLLCELIEMYFEIRRMCV